jgi:hypothetical protein
MINMTNQPLDINLFPVFLFSTFRGCDLSILHVQMTLNIFSLSDLVSVLGSNMVIFPGCPIRFVKKMITIDSVECTNAQTCSVGRSITQDKLFNYIDM